MEPAKYVPGVTSIRCFEEQGSLYAVIGFIDGSLTIMDLLQHCPEAKKLSAELDTAYPKGEEEDEAKRYQEEKEKRQQNREAKKGNGKEEKKKKRPEKEEKVEKKVEKKVERKVEEKVETKGGETPSSTLIPLSSPTHIETVPSKSPSPLTPPVEVFNIPKESYRIRTSPPSFSFLFLLSLLH